MDRRALRRLTRIRPGDIAEAVRVVVITTRIEIALRRHDLPSTAARFGVHLANPRRPDEPPPARGRLPAWAVRRARLAERLLRWWPYGDTCLRKSLVIGNRLAALSPSLFVGVRQSERDGSIEAHAWLEVSGIDLDPTSRHYLAFDFS